MEIKNNAHLSGIYDVFETEIEPAPNNTTTQVIVHKGSYSMASLNAQIAILQTNLTGLQAIQTAINAFIASEAALSSPTPGASN